MQGEAGLGVVLLLVRLPLLFPSGLMLVTVTLTITITVLLFGPEPKT